VIRLLPRKCGAGSGITITAKQAAKSLASPHEQCSSKSRC